MSTEEPKVIVAHSNTGTIRKCSEDGQLLPLDDEKPENAGGVTEKQIKELLATIDVLANLVGQMRKY